ncbi:hypothetical protein LZZ85_03160 [Terrimonas sp. NA20]|uniref:DUF4405 domain-containing protein n=1 Tax=Terrimonas ginsenosidimutans TaxID=2908004 RepID=A0ABS9KLP8_9BACT|nr:hypothetical protein [Terrimonas ginsenosidimutans]MCG2613257.1 hypothetical protein [Terrimonas ginsenosidimutans]
MSRKIQNIHILSAVILLCFVSLPVINLVLSFIVDLPRTMITQRLEQADHSWLIVVLLTASTISHLVAALKLKHQWCHKQVATRQWVRLFAGFYGAAFLLIHLVCVSAGRLISGTKTSFYTGMEGMNTDPLQIVFVIYVVLFTIFFSMQFIYSGYTRFFNFLSGITNNKAGLLQ